MVATIIWWQHFCIVKTFHVMLSNVTSLISHFLTTEQIKGLKKRVWRGHEGGAVGRSLVPFAHGGRGAEFHKRWAVPAGGGKEAEA